MAIGGVRRGSHLGNWDQSWRMQKEEEIRGNAKCSLRNPEFEVSVGYPGRHSSPGDMIPESRAQ